MTDTPAVAKPSRTQRFLEAIEARMKTDSAVRAALKRSLDGTGEHRRAIYPYVLPLLGDVEPYQQDPFLLVAALYALYPTPLKREHSKRFGRTCAHLAAARDSAGPERRFKALLDTDTADLAVPIAALIRLMASEKIDVDYATLLSDMRQWSHPDKWVQDRWAREFWAPSAPASFPEPTLS